VGGDILENTFRKKERDCELRFSLRPFGTAFVKLPMDTPTGHSLIITDYDSGPRGGEMLELSEIQVRK